MNVLSEVAKSTSSFLLKEATKRSKKDFHISHASGLGNGTDFQSGVPDEQQCKISGTYEGTGAKPGVPDVPKYDSESDKESWCDSGEEDDDEDDIENDEGNDDDDNSDGNDDDDDDDDNDGDGDDDDDNDGNDDDDDYDQKGTESDRDENPNLNQFNEEHEEEEEENDDEFTDKEDDEQNEEELDDGEELYKDVNVNLRKEDVEINDANQSGADQHNVSQESRFEQEEEDAHSYFTEKLLNFKNFSLADNEIASLMDTTIRNEEPSSQTSTLFTIPITVFPTTIPPPPHFFNPLPQQTTPTPTPTTSEVTIAFPALVFRFNDRVTNLERDLSEMKQVDRYAQAISSIPAIIDCHMDNKLGEAIHKAIQSHNAECKEEAQAEKQEYIDLADSSMKTIIKEEVKTQLPQILPKVVLDFATPVIEQNVTESLEATVLAKSSSQPKSTYEAAASLLKDPKSIESKSTSSSKGTSRSQHKSSGKSAHAEEPNHTVGDSGVQQNQKFDMGSNDEEPDDEAATKVDYNIARAEYLPTSFDELMDTPIDFYAFIMNQIKITYLTQELLVGPAFNLLKGTCKRCTELEYHFKEFFKATTEWLDWHNPEGKHHLDEIEVRREDQQLYKFKEGDFPRLRLQDIEDMLLLLVEKNLTNLMINERFDLNVALRMFTRRIVVQRRVEDLKLGVESYQKKLNLAKPDTFRSNLKNRTAYTAYPDPQGVIYKDQNNKNILMRTDELDTPNHVRTGLQDITSGIRMEYLPKKK
ncbi:hypothetical protein Tco_1333025 [Tanacetum coccineum]